MICIINKLVNEHKIGEKRKVAVSYLYVVEGDKESEEAICILKNGNINFKKIAVDKNENGRSMFRDLETTETPSLANSNSVYVGLENIKNFVEQSK